MSLSSNVIKYTGRNIHNHVTTSEEAINASLSKNTHIALKQNITSSNFSTFEELAAKYNINMFFDKSMNLISLSGQKNTLQLF